MTLPLDRSGRAEPAAGPSSSGRRTWWVDRALDWVGDPDRSLPSPRSWWTILAAVAAAALALTAGGDPFAPRLVVAVAAIAAATCTSVAWWSNGRYRVGWAAVGLGAVLWCAGSSSRPSWALVASGPLPSLGAGDVAALGAAVAFSIGILAHVERPAARVARLRQLAEALMLAASILFASWVTLLPPAFAAARGRTIGDQAILLSHPFADVLLIAVVAFAVTRIPQLGRRSVLLLGGIGTIALLGSALSQLEPGDLAHLRLLESGATIGFLAVVLAATQAAQVTSPISDQPVPQRAQLALLSAPGLSVLIVIGTTVRQVTGQPVSSELTWITIGVLTLGVLLHVIVVVENHMLSTELALARDEAIHASNLKSRFLANVSHEIRTPMNAVIGLTGLLLDTELEADQRELAVGVATSAEGLLGLIDAVLDFSKIEAEKVEVEAIDLSLADLLDDVAMIVGDGARRKGVELYAYCEPGLAIMRRGDPVRLRQILLNLAGNAVKFTHQGSVTIQAIPVEDAPDQVAFLVIDTGIGIPQAEQARLFEPFSQLDETTTRTYGGTGLGLGIVTGLVDLMGGTIEMVSEVGVGTAFRIVLPLPAGDQRATERVLGDLVGLRALVVDDNAVNRSVLAHTLHSWGFVVDQATTAEEALHHYTWSGTPDRGYALAIIEHRLAGMGGIELARILRTQGPTSGAAILLLTSQVDLSRQDAHDAGIESVLVKPVRNTYLLRRIIDALIPAPTTTPSPSIPAVAPTATAPRKVPAHAASAHR